MKLSIGTAISVFPVFAARPVRRKPASGGSLCACLTFVFVSLLLGSLHIALARQVSEGGEDRVKALISQLHAPDVDVRRHASRALGEMGAEAKLAVPMLAASVRAGVLGETDPEVRSNAAWALGRIGVAAKETAPDLAAAIRDEASTVRAAAAYALGSIGGDAGTVLSALSSALRDKDHEVRSAAGFALADIGSAAIPVIVAALNDKVSAVRADAATALGGWSKPPKAAIPALVAVLGDPDAEVRKNVEWALHGMGGAAVAALITALHAKRSVVRSAAAAALGGIGAEAQSAAPALWLALRDPVANVRRAADNALMFTGTPATSQEQEHAVQDAVIKYVFEHFGGKLVLVRLGIGTVSPTQLQRLQRAGIPARLDSDQSRAEMKALPQEAGIMFMTIASLRWMSRELVLARVEAFTGTRGNEDAVWEHYAQLSVRRTHGEWEVQGPLGEWEQGGE